MKDPQRALKWTQRGDDWARLAETAREDYVRSTCGKFAAAVAAASAFPL